MDPLNAPIITLILEQVRLEKVKGDSVSSYHFIFIRRMYSYITMQLILWRDYRLKQSWFWKQHCLSSQFCSQGNLNQTPQCVSLPNQTQDGDQSGLSSGLLLLNKPGGLKLLIWLTWHREFLAIPSDSTQDCPHKQPEIILIYKVQLLLGSLAQRISLHQKLSGFAKKKCVTILPR